MMNRLTQFIPDKNERNHYSVNLRFKSRSYHRVPYEVIMLITNHKNSVEDKFFLCCHEIIHVHIIQIDHYVNAFSISC